MKNKLKRLPSIPLEPELMDRLEAYCVKAGGNRTDVVRVAIKEFLDRTTIKKEDHNG